MCTKFFLVFFLVVEIKLDIIVVEFMNRFLTENNWSITKIDDYIITFFIDFFTDYHFMEF